MRAVRLLERVALRQLTVVALLLSSAFAYGAERSAAKKPDGDPCFHYRPCLAHVESATIFVEIGLYGDALPEYRAAYALRPTPWLLFQIGRTLQQLERPLEAIGYYKRYLDITDGTDLEKRNLAQKNLQAAQQAADTAALGLPLVAEPVAPKAEPVVVQAAPPIFEAPIYKKGWLWVAVGITSAVVAFGVAGVVLATTHGKPDPVPSGWLTYHPFN